MPTSLANHEALAACDRLARILERSEAMPPDPAQRGQDAIRVPLFRYALAIVRSRLRPALQPGWATDDPVHVAMFGGTNSGKSTVLNVLLGRPAAGMNSLARYSQHPEAYRPEALGDAFLDAYPTRFAGYVRHRDRHPPRQPDAELRGRGYLPALAVNDPERLPGPMLARPAADRAVLWDIPDFSTEEASAYMAAVLDTVAVADLVVMAVTNENYADHRGALLRDLIIESGVPLRVVANKLEPGSALLEDIRFKLGGGIAMGDDGQGRRVPPDRVLPLPHVRREDDGARLEALIATPEAATLRRALADDVARGPALKRQALAGALEFLDHRLDDLLAPLKAEVTVAEQWALTVARLSEREFYDRHRRHYLNDEKYVDFNQTLVKLMDKLEIPGIGPYISSLSKGIKSVSRFVVGGVMNLARAALGRPNPKLQRMPEEEVVIDAFERWYEALKAEAQLHAASGGHPAWATIARKLGSHKFYGSFVGDLGAAYQGYRERMDRITAERAQSIYEVIATKPRLLNMLRGVKATLDVGTTGLIVASHGLDWTDAVIAPLVAPVQRLILEFGLQKVLDAERARLKAQQVAAFRDVIDERMIRPVRELFRGAVRPEDLHAARRDLETLRDALSVAGGMGR